MPRRPPSTYLTADELKQIAAIKFEEGVPTTPGQVQNEPADHHQNLAMKCYLASKELEPEKCATRLQYLKRGKLCMKRRNLVWSEEELKQLVEFVASGGTPLRASVRFQRTIASCRIQARKMGVPFEHTMIRRRNTLAKCAAAEKELSR